MSLPNKSLHTFKLTLLMSALSTSLSLAETGSEPRQAVPKVDAWRELSDYWRSIEPELFTETGSKKHLGEWVRVEGKLVSHGSPLIVRLPSGTASSLLSASSPSSALLWNCASY
ncbi:MAG TPA: hypothetical protein VGH90_14300 [Chthoniobacteraceae bacterium]|jgi:hypothetical protein